jgi:hypothetical protein
VEMVLLTLLTFNSVWLRITCNTLSCSWASSS